MICHRLRGLFCGELSLPFCGRREALDEILAAIDVRMECRIRRMEGVAKLVKLTTLHGILELLFRDGWIRSRRVYPALPALVRAVLRLLCLLRCCARRLLLVTLGRSAHALAIGGQSGRGTGSGARCTGLT